MLYSDLISPNIFHKKIDPFTIIILLVRLPLAPVYSFITRIITFATNECVSFTTA